MTTPEQELILRVTDDPAVAKILCDIYKQIDGEPILAARMMRAFQSVNQVLDETLKELPAKWQQLEHEVSKADLRRTAFLEDLRDFRSGTMTEVAAAVKDLAELEKLFVRLDDDTFMNKANRLLELCEKLTKAKRDGTLDWLKKVLTP